MSSQDLAAIMSENKQSENGATSGGIMAMLQEGMREFKAFLGTNKDKVTSTELVSEQVKKEESSLSETISLSTRSKNLAPNQIDIGMVKREQQKKESRLHDSLLP